MKDLACNDCGANVREGHGLLVFYTVRIDAKGAESPAAWCIRCLSGPRYPWSLVWLEV